MDLNTNLADLPLNKFRQLAQCLLKNDTWLKIVDGEERTIYSMSSDEVENIMRSKNFGEAVLRVWGNRGQTVYEFLIHLQKLSRFHDNFDEIQLVLNRKFKELKWGREEQIIIKKNEKFIQLECKAVGFPTPIVNWYKSDDLSNSIYTGKIFNMISCKCTAECQYRCQAINEIQDGYAYSPFYKKPGKTSKSSLTSKLVDVSDFVEDNELCEECSSRKYTEMKQIIEEKPSGSNHQAANNFFNDGEALVAADKVALVISNCSYQYLPELVTPHCDAQMLSEALQRMNFKTLTLADLTLEEMRYFIRKYRRLLGNGVYAVFYFVGHGFEVNGQCYLLATDAPLDAHKPQNALSMDWILSMFRDVSPALNLLLLDVCRKFVPYECIPSFVEYAEQFKRNHRAYRNIVYGYSTSGGVGAYEIKGEVNGVFMKYLKNHVELNCPVIDMLNKVLNDIGKDEKVCDVQVPEIRTTLTHPRGLADPLEFDGHTASFDNHTIFWRLIHELPKPVKIRFEDVQLIVTIWFDYCGRFTNKVYALSSVADLRDTQSNHDEDNGEINERALQHRAFLSFQQDVHSSPGKEFSDDIEGLSMYWLLSGLQKMQEHDYLKCCVELRNIEELEKVISSKTVDIGHILITKIKCT